MNTVIGYGVGLAYLVGLLITGWIGADPLSVTVGAIAPLLVGTGLALSVPRIWRKGPGPGGWAIAGLVASLASLYLYLRLPVAPPVNLQETLATLSAQPSAAICVHGNILKDPQLTRNGRFRFELKATTVYPAPDPDAPCDRVSQSITPQSFPCRDVLYVTTPHFKSPVLFPGIEVAIRGSLYTPRAAQNPGGFDFQAYLARQGIFEGLAGEWVEVMRPNQTPPIPWRIRRRIVHALEAGLGTPAGTLLSAMVLGRRAVDLPYELRDAFTQAGLAHTLAASGFHVSLLLGLVLALSARLAPRDRVVISSLTLLAYISMTGLQASVIRAAIMGLAALTAPLLERKTRPLAVLLWAAVLILLANPLWIWDLGFQFSFLATLGLIVTVPPLVKKLDWMPPAIATVLAVPIAAILWTLPLQLFVFGVVPPYSLLLNGLTTPLITLISLGGMVSGAIAGVLPSLGSLLASLLYFPIHLLIVVVNSFNRLPYSSFAAGSLSLLQLLLVYSLFGLVWLRRDRRLRVLLGAIALAVVVIPGWYIQTSRLRLTVLAADQDPVLVIQDRGTVGIIGYASPSTTQYTLQPFLRQQGINQIDWAIASRLPTPNPADWHPTQQTVPVQTLYAPAIAPPEPPGPENPPPQTLSAPGSPITLLPQQPLFLGNVSIQLIAARPFVLHLQIEEQPWLMVDTNSPVPPDTPPDLPQLAGLDCDLLWWAGDRLDPNFLSVVNPQRAIASSKQVDPVSQSWFEEQKIDLFVTGVDGAIQWTEAQGIQPALSSAGDATL
ncbi:MAG: ComEC/Rec2 family competence protein [Synechococcales bacterium]|nr:ComEC/Rec2 family competence protein [Synechococcales bacterium]